MRYNGFDQLVGVEVEEAQKVVFSAGHCHAKLVTDLKHIGLLGSHAAMVLEFEIKVSFLLSSLSVIDVHVGSLVTGEEGVLAEPAAACGHQTLPHGLGLHEAVAEGLLGVFRAIVPQTNGGIRPYGKQVRLEGVSSEVPNRLILMSVVPCTHAVGLIFVRAIRLNLVNRRNLPPPDLTVLRTREYHIVRVATEREDGGEVAAQGQVGV